MPTYNIKHSHGLTERADDYEGAIEVVTTVYGSDAAIGHDGDISEGGERTLCWRSEEEAENDDGSRACAVITQKHD